MSSAIVYQMPPELAVDTTRLPDDENALLPLREACRLAVSHGPEWFDDFWVNRDDDDIAPIPEEIRNQSKNADDAFEQLDKAIAIRKIQLIDPSRDRADFESFSRLDELQGIRALARLGSLRFDIRADDGDFEAALAELRRIIALGRLLAEGNGLVTHALTAMALSGGAERALLELCENEVVPDDVLVVALTLVEDMPEEREMFIAALKSEFSLWSVPYVDTFPEEESIESLIEALLDVSCGTDDHLPEDARQRKRALRVRSRSDLDLLLKEHPRPFDKMLTLEWIAEATIDAIAELLSPATRAPLNVASHARSGLRALRRWKRNRLTYRIPPAVFPAQSELMDIESPEEEYAELQAELEADLPRLFKRPSGEELNKLRRRLRRSTNPVGCWLFGQFMPTPMAWPVLQWKAGRRVTAAVVALRLYEKRYGAPPEKLSELVNAGIVPSVPADPFGYRELGYDAKERLVWSSGEKRLRSMRCPNTDLWRTDLCWQIRPRSERRSNDQNTSPV